MTMSVECPACHTRFKVEDQHAGKCARCRQCKEVFQVPAAAGDVAEAGLVPIDDEPPPSRMVQRSSAEKPRSAVVEIVSAPKPAPPAAEDDSAGYMLADGAARKAKAVRARPDRLPGVGVSGVSDAAAATIKTLTPEQILASFGNAIEPVKPTPLYRLWVAIVAAVMVLLPVVYLGLVGLLAAGLVYHAVHDVTVFQTLGGNRGSAKAAVAVYFGPLFAGGTVVLFMLKPFFARSGRREKQRVLDPEVEPLLYAFVDGICTVGRRTRIPAGSRSTRMSTPAPAAMAPCSVFSAAIWCSRSGCRWQPG